MATLLSIFIDFIEAIHEKFMINFLHAVAPLKKKLFLKKNYQI